jgi:hypothetical protein
MRIIGYLIYLGVGLVQLFATMDGLEHWLGLPGFLAGIGAFILAYIPIVGTIFGFIGAVDVWGWEWWQAALLFFGAFIVFIAFTAGAGVLETWARRKTPQS